MLVHFLDLITVGIGAATAILSVVIAVALGIAIAKGLHS